VTAFAAGLSDRGYDVTLVAPTPDQDLPARLSGIKASFVSTPNRGVIDQPVRATLIARRARKIARQQGATVQFEHSTLGGVGQLLGEREFVLDMHDLAHASPLYGDLPLGSSIQRVIRGIEGRAVESAEEIVVVSENMRELVSDAWDVDPETINVVPNGYFSENVDPYRTTDTVEGRVTFLGTLHPKLDTEAIFEIAQLPEVEEMVVIGDGAERETLEAGKNERGLDDLHVRGRLPDEEAFKILGRSAVAINPQMPSSLQRASSPVKIFYYAGLGLPMVLSEGPSVAHRLAERDAARVVPFDDSLSEAVREVVADQSLRREMAETAASVAADLSWTSRVGDLARLYER
jgi:glycosyltransferase involved in cell wall biosynthesis